MDPRIPDQRSCGICRPGLVGLVTFLRKVISSPIIITREAHFLVLFTCEGAEMMLVYFYLSMLRLLCRQIRARTPT